IGPLARSVDDLELSLVELAGPNTLGGGRARSLLPPPRSSSLAGYRLAVWFDEPTLVVDGEVKAVLRRAVDQLADAGARAEEAQPPIDVEAALRTYFFLLGAAMGSGDPAAVAVGRSLPPATADEPLEMAFTRGAAADVVAWNEARAAQAAVRQAWARFHDSYD